MNKKVIIFVTAMVLVFAMVTGATFAYLFSSSDEVENVFKPTYIGDPNVSESDDLDLAIVPGVAITKDPVVKYTPDTKSEKIDTVVLYATLDLAGSTWTYDATNKKFTFTASGNTLDFTINTTNWNYVGKTADGKYVLSYTKVLDGTTASASFGVIKDNTVNVSTGWTEDQINTTFASGGVKITVGSFVAQALPTVDTAAGTSVSAANAKTIWNNCGQSKIS